MYPHGYHHNGFMATPALGTQEVLIHTVLCSIVSICFTFTVQLYALLSLL